MKKTYIQPSIEAVKIQNAVMQATSITMNETPSTTPTPGNTLSIRDDWGEVEE